MIGGWRRVGPRAWRVPLLCGMGMVILQTGLAIYRFGETTSLREWVNPLMWVGLGLFFVTGGLIGLVIERLLRGTTGPHPAAGRDDPGHPRGDWCEPRGGLFGPPGVLIYGLIPYLLLVGIPRLIGNGWEARSGRRG